MFRQQNHYKTATVRAEGRRRYSLMRAGEFGAWFAFGLWASSPGSFSGACPASISNLSPSRIASRRFSFDCAVDSLVGVTFDISFLSLSIVGASGPARSIHPSPPTEDSKRDAPVLNRAPYAPTGDAGTIEWTGI